MRFTPPGPKAPFSLPRHLDCHTTPLIEERRTNAILSNGKYLYEKAFFYFVCRLYYNKIMAFRKPCLLQSSGEKEKVTSPSRWTPYFSLSQTSKIFSLCRVTKTAPNFEMYIFPSLVKEWHFKACYTSWTVWAVCDDGDDLTCSVKSDQVFSRNSPATITICMSQKKKKLYWCYTYLGSPCAMCCM